MENLGIFVSNHWVLVSLFVMVLIALVFTELRRGSLGFKDLNPNDTVRLMNSEDAALLDVRDDTEFKSGHVLNAIHIPLGLLESRIRELEAHREKPIVVYCRTGQRSAQASAILGKQGFTKVYKMSGGILAWQSANMPLVK
jgi:rhodanese-related sulfurtransferase